MALASITSAAIEARGKSLSETTSTQTKALALMHGSFRRARKVWDLPVKPVVDVETPLLTRSGDLQMFSPEEVWDRPRPPATASGT